MTGTLTLQRIQNQSTITKPIIIMRNLSIFVFVSIFVFLASSCQRVEIAPSKDSFFDNTQAVAKTNVLTAPNNFSVTNISDKNMTFEWDGVEGEEGYLLSIYTNEGVFVNSYTLAASVHQYTTTNLGEGSFNAVLKRLNGDDILSEGARTAVTVCCGTPVVIDDESEALIHNGQSVCSDDDVTAYTLTSSQGLTTLSHTIYGDASDYMVIYGFVNTENAVPTSYNMIPMSNILTVNAATNVKHTLQLDFQNYQYCKVYFIPWNFANCSVF